MREAYRLQKQALPESPKLLIGYVYTHKEIMVLGEMKGKMLQTFGKISKTFSPKLPLSP
jgi:hypothetical protein